MIRPKNETKNLLPSITKNYETLINQNIKAEETLEFKATKSRETFPLKPPISIEGPWMIGLTRLEVHKAVSNIIREKTI